MSHEVNAALAANFAWGLLTNALDCFGLDADVRPIGTDVYFAGQSYRSPGMS